MSDYYRRPVPREEACFACACPIEPLGQIEHMSDVNGFYIGLLQRSDNLARDFRTLLERAPLM